MITHTKITIKPIELDDWNEAMGLAWRTFMVYNAPDYSMQGQTSFRDFISDKILYRMFMIGEYKVFGAYDDTNRLVGMISLRDKILISLLFVEGTYHNQGVGKALIDYLCDYVLHKEGYHTVKVQAAPYATGFYHKLGFYDVGDIRYNDGISFTPMELRLKYY